LYFSVKKARPGYIPNNEKSKIIFTSDKKRNSFRTSSHFFPKSENHFVHQTIYFSKHEHYIKSINVINPFHLFFPLPPPHTESHCTKFSSHTPALCERSGGLGSDRIPTISVSGSAGGCPHSR
jgi:hypothetical protein